MGDQGYGLHPPTVQRIARRGEIGPRPRRRDLHGDRRRQHLPRAAGLGPGDGADDGRLHGHAGHGDERAGHAVGAGGARRLHPRDQRHPDGSGLRALYPPPRRAAPGEEARRASSPPAPATPISPPTRRRRCAPTRWPARRSSRAPRWTASMTRTPRSTPMPSAMTRVTYDEVLQKHLGVMDATRHRAGPRQRPADHRLLAGRTGRVPRHPRGAGHLYHGSGLTVPPRPYTLAVTAAGIDRETRACATRDEEGHPDEPGRPPRSTSMPSSAAWMAR